MFAAHPQARVLLVAADAAVRDASHLLLRTEGYEVLAVATFAEALEDLARTSAEFFADPQTRVVNKPSRDGELLSQLKELLAVHDGWAGKPG